jgi:hypothetical protein
MASGSKLLSSTGRTRLLPQADRYKPGIRGHFARLVAAATQRPNELGRMNVWHYAGVNTFRAGRLDELQSPRDRARQVPPHPHYGRGHQGNQKRMCSGGGRLPHFVERSADTCHAALAKMTSAVGVPGPAPFTKSLPARVGKLKPSKADHRAKRIVSRWPRGAALDGGGARARAPDRASCARSREEPRMGVSLSTVNRAHMAYDQGAQAQTERWTQAREYGLSRGKGLARPFCKASRRRRDIEHP